ncbi:hypothetical protein MTBBW1_80199 [Desulfamplus magnetovallimortis]|uniref:Uncharacterized protein n=1 Tax=Desulfamplus magnetovallimortis TaxID=1246637 RepID=L0R5K1_9BACT|nr:recombinase family protein [Desulfamplus magnetovallimortis]CCO06805.1 hypothetical protein DEMABW1_80199 [Desulfamplus magnetovallimortis BW-1]SLM32856.1 hypothetical protein MTBBW1_80199 [Desulfamplus magnetovallimortis]
MKYLSIPQIATKLDINENTIRRYITRFSMFFNDIQISDQTEKYAPDAVNIIRDINTCYSKKGLRKDAIIELLGEKYTCKTPSAPETNDNTANGTSMKSLSSDTQALSDIQGLVVRMENIESKIEYILDKIINNLPSSTTDQDHSVHSGKKNHVLPEVERETNLPEKIEEPAAQKKIEEEPIKIKEETASEAKIEEPDTIDTYSEVDSGLSNENSISKDLTTTDSESDSEEFDKDQVSKVIANLKDNQNMTWVEISYQLKEMGYRPPDKNRERFHHLAIANYYKYGKNRFSTESIDNALTPQFPDNQNDEPKNKSLETDQQKSSISSEEKEENSYLSDSKEQNGVKTDDKNATDNIQSSDKNEKNNSDDIKSSDESEKNEIEDFKSSDENENEIENLKPSEAANTPDWEQKEEYREFTLNLILKLKKSGMTYKEIKETLYKMGIKTRKGMDKWSTGTIGNIITAADQSGSKKRKKAKKSKKTKKK